MAGVDVPGWADVMANRIDRVSTVETSPGHRLVMLAGLRADFSRAADRLTRLRTPHNNDELEAAVALVCHRLGAAEERVRHGLGVQRQGEALGGVVERRQLAMA